MFGLKTAVFWTLTDDGIILGPDNIPSETFLGPKRNRREELPSLPYYADPHKLRDSPCTWLRLIRYSFEKIIEDLLDLAFIKGNSRTAQSSFHCVVQLVYRESQSPNQHVTILAKTTDKYRLDARTLIHTRDFCSCIVIKIHGTVIPRPLILSMYPHQSICLTQYLNILAIAFKLRGEDQSLRENLLNIAATIV